MNNRKSNQWGQTRLIREATNKSWVLGDDRFRKQIEKMVTRQATLKARDGDRKSVKYRKSVIDRA